MVGASRSPTPRRRGTSNARVVVVGSGGGGGGVNLLRPPPPRQVPHLGERLEHQLPWGIDQTREITISRSAVADSAGAPRPVVLISYSSRLAPASRSCTYSSSRLEAPRSRTPLEPARPLVNRSKPSGVKAATGAACLPCGPGTSPTSRSTRAGVWTPPAGPSPAPGPARSPSQLTRPQQHEDLPPLLLGDRVEITSDVVAARATVLHYIPISACVKPGESSEPCSAARRCWTGKRSTTICSCRNTRST